MFASGIQYAEGHSGPYCAMTQCIDCGGKKEIPEAMLEWRKRGKEIREWRRGHDLTLRDAAERCGLRPSDVSYLECGRINNADWRNILKADMFGKSEEVSDE